MLSFVFVWHHIRLGIVLTWQHLGYIRRESLPFLGLHDNIWVISASDQMQSFWMQAIVSGWRWLTTLFTITIPILLWYCFKLVSVTKQYQTIVDYWNSSNIFHCMPCNLTLSEMTCSGFYKTSEVSIPWSFGWIPGDGCSLLGTQKLSIHLFVWTSVDNTLISPDLSSSILLNQLKTNSEENVF